jgi:hypothetical protein
MNPGLVNLDFQWPASQFLSNMCNASRCSDPGALPRSAQISSMQAVRIVFENGIPTHLKRVLRGQVGPLKEACTRFLADSVSSNTAGASPEHAEANGVSNLPVQYRAVNPNVSAHLARKSLGFFPPQKACLFTDRCIKSHNA